LPLIRTWHTESCMIYAKFYTLHSGVTFYVAEGEQRDLDYLFWGLLIVPQFKFPLRLELTLSQLQTTDWVGQEPYQRDETFLSARWGIIRCGFPGFRIRK
jgi:hypothetical protein